MKPIKVEINQEFIRLCDLLKVAGLADSGARGKHLVADGMVTVDGQAESRKTAKIRPGQKVACHGQLIQVAAAKAS
jgi:ribosome-associated protein